MNDINRVWEKKNSNENCRIQKKMVFEPKKINTTTIY